MLDDGNAVIADARERHLRQIAVINDGAINAHKFCGFNVVRCVAHIKHLRAVVTEFPQMRGTAADFVSAQIVRAAQARKIKIEVVFGEHGSEPFVRIRRKNRLAQPHFVDFVNESPRAVVQVAVVAFLLVSVHKIDANFVESHGIVHGNAQIAVNIDERKFKNFAVMFGRAGRQIQQFQLFIKTFDAKQKIVQQRAVPIPNNVSIIEQVSHETIIRFLFFGCIDGNAERRQRFRFKRSKLRERNREARRSRGNVRD